jgi:hypothetical protein
MSFHQELLMHMIVLCLVRMVMLDVSRAVKIPVAQLSFSRTLTKTRLFLSLLLIKTCVLSNAVVWNKTTDADQFCGIFYFYESSIYLHHSFAA